MFLDLFIDKVLHEEECRNFDFKRDENGEITDQSLEEFAELIVTKVLIPIKNYNNEH